jgi:hypothetical protein
MSLLRINSFKMTCRSKEDATTFLKRLNLILSLHELEGEKGSYEYSIEEQNQIIPVKIGVYNDPPA